jgi:hypothetical protein
MPAYWYRHGKKPKSGRETRAYACESIRALLRTSKELSLKMETRHKHTAKQWPHKISISNLHHKGQTESKTHNYIKRTVSAELNSLAGRIRYKGIAEKYRYWLRSLQLTLAVVARKSSPMLVSTNRRISIKNTLDWSAVTFCVYKFDFRFVTDLNNFVIQWRRLVFLADLYVCRRECQGILPALCTSSTFSCVKTFDTPRGLHGDTTPYRNINTVAWRKKQNTQFLKLPTINAEMEKSGWLVDWLVGDTQSEARVGGVSYCFPHAFRTK